MDELGRNEYIEEIAEKIVVMVEKAKGELASSVNNIMRDTYWSITDPRAEMKKAEFQKNRRRLPAKNREESL